MKGLRICTVTFRTILYYKSTYIHTINLCPVESFFETPFVVYNSLVFDN